MIFSAQACDGVITVIDNRSRCPGFPLNLGHFLPRPDSSRLHHPPISPANCGTAETGGIFRAAGGVLQDSVAPETR